MGHSVKFQFCKKNCTEENLWIGNWLLKGQCHENDVIVDIRKMVARVFQAQYFKFDKSSGHKPT